MNKYTLIISAAINLISYNEFAHEIMQIIEVNDQNFASIVLYAEKPVVVDFFASWCPPCKYMKQIFESLAKKYGKQYIFVMINIEQALQTVEKYSVQSVPAFAVFNKGNLCGMFTGNISAYSFEERIREYLEKSKTS